MPNNIEYYNQVEGTEVFKHIPKRHTNNKWKCVFLESEKFSTTKKNLSYQSKV